MKKLIAFLVLIVYVNGLAYASSVSSLGAHTAASAGTQIVCGVNPSYTVTNSSDVLVTQRLNSGVVACSTCNNTDLNVWGQVATSSSAVLSDGATDYYTLNSNVNFSVRTYVVDGSTVACLNNPSSYSAPSTLVNYIVPSSSTFDGALRLSVIAQ